MPWKEYDVMDQKLAFVIKSFEKEKSFTMLSPFVKTFFYLNKVNCFHLHAALLTTFSQNGTIYASLGVK